MMKTVWMVLLYLCIFSLSIYLYSAQSNGPAAELHQRLLPVEIKTVKAGMSEEELQKIAAEAKKNEDILSIAGMQHSQGPQTV